MRYNALYDKNLCVNGGPKKCRKACNSCRAVQDYREYSGLDSDNNPIGYPKPDSELNDPCGKLKYENEVLSI